MTYAMFYDVPADEPMYRQVKGLIGDEVPEGLVVNLVVKNGGGLRHIGVWETEAHWQQFHDERVEPAVHQVLTGIGFTTMPPKPLIERLDLIDVWLG